MVRQILRPLPIIREMPLDRQVLLQSPLKATGAISNTFSELQLETCTADLPGQFKQPGYIDVQGCLWSEFYFIFLCLRSWIDSHTSGAKPPSLSAPLQRWRKLILPTKRFLHHGMQAKASLMFSLAMNTVCMFTFIFSVLGDLQLKRSWMDQESFWHRRKLRHR